MALSKGCSPDCVETGSEYDTFGQYCCNTDACNAAESDTRGNLKDNLNIISFISFSSRLFLKFVS